MRFQTTLLATFACAALSSAGAQTIYTPRASSRATLVPAFGLADPRAVIGISTSVSTGVRDTLGLLVSAVTRNGPAEKAGIEEGNRIAAINGVSLRLAAADLGDPDMERLMGRRLTRELDKVKPGDDVELRVYGNGQTRSLKVKTVDPESLYENNRTAMRRSMDERPSLGMSLGSTGSRRDTLGVFVMSVEENGPAAKAGIEEGNRIAAINGVDLRVSRDDAGDDMVSITRLNRLERELAKVKVGDPVELRVVANGQTRTVKATTVASSAFRGRNSVRIIHDGGGVTATIRPPMSFNLDIDGDQIGTTVRRAIERAQTVTGERLEDLGGMLDNIGRSLNTGGTIRWLQDDDDTLRQPHDTAVPPWRGAAAQHDPHVKARAGAGRCENGARCLAPFLFEVRTRPVRPARRRGSAEYQKTRSPIARCAT
jgi:serine protease Do